METFFAGTSSIMISYLVLLLLFWEVAATDLNDGRPKEINLCSAPEIPHFRCPTGTTIDVDDVICGLDRRLCDSLTSQKLRNVCQGQPTCSNVGLTSLFGSACLYQSWQGIRVRYKCVPGTTSKCLANICDDQSPGLSCPEGTNIHIQGMNCSTGSSPCSKGSYVTMYSLCEGSSRCAASGLRFLLKEECSQNASLLVDYICMPNFQPASSCSVTKEKVLNRNFGVIKTPRDPPNRLLKFTQTTPDEPLRCKWIIPSKNANVKVTVHIAEPTTNLKSEVLRVAYFDCTRGARQLKTFTEVAGKGEEILSCGPVLVTSSVPVGIADDFLLSYQRMIDGRREPAECLVPPTPTPPPTSSPTVPVVRTSDTTTTDIRSTISTVKPKQPGPDVATSGGKQDLKKPGYQNDEETPEMGNSKRSTSLTKDLKKLILYVVFGVVILILLVALIAVIISYRRLSRYKKTRDAGEKLALWKKEDTPLDTFQHNGWPDHSPALNSRSTVLGDNHHSTQVVATIHNNGIYDSNDTDNRISTGSGISTFLPDKRDSGFKDLINTFQTGTFDLYSTVEESGGRGNAQRSSSPPESYGYDVTSGDIYEAIDPDLKKQSKPLPPLPPVTSNNSDFISEEAHDLQPLVHQSPLPSDDLHYCINGDEYAIVNKPRRVQRPQSDNPSYNSDSSREHSPFVQRNEHNINFRPSSGPYDTSSGPYDPRSGQYDERSRPYDSRSGQYDARSGPYDSRSGQYDARSGQYDASTVPHERSWHPSRRNGYGSRGSGWSEDL